MTTRILLSAISAFVFFVGCFDIHTAFASLRNDSGMRVENTRNDVRVPRIEPAWSLDREILVHSHNELLENVSYRIALIGDNLPLSATPWQRLKHQDISGVALTLTPDEAVRVALRDGVIRHEIPIEVRKTVRIRRDPSQDEMTTFAKVEELKAVVSRHGWTVIGFATSDENSDWVTGEIVPPAAAEPWIGEEVSIDDGQAYDAIFLEHVDVDAVDFVVDANQARGTFRAQFSDCTAICQLWLDVRETNDEIAGLIFPDYNPQFPLDTNQTFTVSGKLDFAWSPIRGWRVISAKK